MRIFVLRSSRRTLICKLKPSLQSCDHVFLFSWCLSPNVFDECPLMFQAIKDNFLESFREVDITLSKKYSFGILANMLTTLH